MPKIYFTAVVLLLSACLNEKPEVFECDPSIYLSNTHKLEGYTDKISYAPGETIAFMVHSLTDYVDVEVFRYGVTTTAVANADSIPAFEQPYHCRSYSTGCNWDTTYSLQVPTTGWTSGMYAAVFTNALNETAYLTFVVKSDPTSPADVLVLASTNTWQAYNRWGGHSFYNYDMDEFRDRSTIISFHRPNTRVLPVGETGHLVAAELHLLRWLENHHYNFDVVGDIDLHQMPNLLDGYKVMILNVHPEYWSTEMYDQTENFIANGGSVMYLGGNGVFHKVGLKYNRIEVKAEGETHAYADGPGGRWRDVDRPESTLLGVAYDRRGYDTYAPYEVVDANHWVFDGLNLNEGDLIGDSCLNGAGASGHETDKMDGNSPAEAVLLAKGTNPNDGGASMVMIEYAGGGKVFSVGSVSYTGSLPVDSAVSRITRNVLYDFLQQ